ncbi:MAG: CHASE2 domain-containing protein [Cyanothece sp. SIO1E1]|nr:CHASE2 domain-containing protein [Cyanothece sp. SIO1E1]
MRVLKALHPGILGLGMGCGLCLSLFLSEVPVIKRLESRLQDTLAVVQSPNAPPTDDILLIEVEEQDLIGLPNEQTKYAALAEHLIQKGAAVIVLNLLDNWATESFESTYSPLQALVKAYKDQIVLVTPTIQSSLSTILEIETYYHLLPPFVGDEIRSAYDVTEIQGFFEYENNDKQVDSPARIAHLYSNFLYNDPAYGQDVGEFKSAALLAFEKFQQRLHTDTSPKKHSFSASKLPIKFKFFGKAGTFPRLKFADVCVSGPNGSCADSSDGDITQKIQNKIIIIGFIAPENNQKVFLPVATPFGDTMPGIEVQANILAGLLANSVYQMSPRWLVQVVIMIGAVLISHLSTFKYPQSF